MASHFRLPGPEDRDESARERGHTSAITARVRTILGAVGGAIAALAVIGYFVITSAAGLFSCISSVGTERGNSLRPREPNLRSGVEYRLVRRLANAWVSSGGSIDSLSVWFVDDSTINSASVGGGVFVLWRGLEQLSNEDLDVIYAHEIAHDQLQHARKVSDVADVTNFVGEALGTLSGGEERATATLKRWSGAFVVPRYSREQELQADDRAVSLLASFGYREPAVTVCLAFGRLRDSVGEAGGGFFEDHPALTERMTAIRLRHPSAAVALVCK